MSVLSEIECLTDEERQAIVLASFYEKVCLARGIYCRYLVLKDGRLKLNHGIFCSLVRWFGSKGWGVGRFYPEWQDYIEFVFRRFSPEIPPPARLRGELLFRKYRLSRPDPAKDTRPIRSRESLHAIYEQILGEKQAEQLLSAP